MIMKKIFSILPVIALIFFTGCLKDKPNVDFSGLGVMSEITTASTSATVNAPAAGLDFFTGANLSFSDPVAPATVWFTVNIASPNVPSKDIPITVAVDPQALNTYISNPNNVQYSIFPDSTFSFATKTGTVRSGHRLDSFFVTFYPAKIDPTKSFMLPISITSAPGTTISGNFGTIYFHKVGNPLAGTYNVTGTRYNYSGVIGYTGGPIPAGYISTAASPSPKVAVPLDPKTITLDYANLGGNGYQYQIAWDPANPNTVAVTPNSTLGGAVSNFLVTTHTYNPATKTIHITSTYNNGANGSGSDRVIDETFVHQ
jgi:hypothetical protein